MIVTVSDDQTAKVWSPALEGIRKLPLDGAYGVAAVISPDTSRIAIGSTKRFEVWDTQTWKRLHTTDQRVVALAWEGAILALAENASKEVVLLDGGTFEERGRLAGHLDTVHTLALSGDGANLLSGSKDRTARMWDTGTGEQLQIYVGHRSSILAVTMGPAGVIATASADKSAVVWHAVTGEPLRSLSGHKDWVTGVLFDPAGKDGLVTAGRDQTLRYWDITTGASLNVVEPGAGALEAMAPLGSEVIVVGEGMHVEPTGPYFVDRQPLKPRPPRLDKRCKPVIDCAVARYQAEQIDPSRVWRTVAEAREQSSGDPRACRGLLRDLQSVEGDPPEACVPAP